jgi:hypothetical protein
MIKRYLVRFLTLKIYGTRSCKYICLENLSTHQRERTTFFLLLAFEEMSLIIINRRKQQPHQKKDRNSVCCELRPHFMITRHDDYLRCTKYGTNLFFTCAFTSLFFIHSFKAVQMALQQKIKEFSPWNESDQ